MQFTKYNKNMLKKCWHGKDILAWLSQTKSRMIKYHSNQQKKQTSDSKNTIFFSSLNIT